MPGDAATLVDVLRALRPATRLDELWSTIQGDTPKLEEVPEP